MSDYFKSLHTVLRDYLREMSEEHAYVQYREFSSDIRKVLAFDDEDNQ